MQGSRLFLVLPAHGFIIPSKLADSARLLIEGARRQAEGFLRMHVEALAVNAREHRIWRIERRKFPAAFRFLSKTYLFMNVGCLLMDAPPFSQLMRQARESGIAWIGEKSNGETHAVAVSLPFPVPGLLALSRCFKHFWHMLARLSACADEYTAHATYGFPKDVLPPGPCSMENSPSMSGVRGARSRPWGNSPSYLNTALQEILMHPAYSHPVNRDPYRMSEALEAQGRLSQVPWIFNTLVNEIEYRQGCVKPQSLPPEIHLSLTGRCNLECRFCSYTHSISRPDFVDLTAIQKLDVLRNIQTFRLHSGLGEPTLNRRLPDIIPYLSNRFPHLAMNFFTNGLLLNRPGLIQAMLGKVRWINVSLNAATPGIWKEVCQTDQFHRVCHNVRELHREKRMEGWLWPLVHGSMVITAANIVDLPRMPELCHQLGVDRLTLFPFFALGYGNADKYGPDMTLEVCRKAFDAVHQETVDRASDYQVTLEMPVPMHQARTAFGMEIRPVNDFAHIESNEWPLGRLLTGLDFDHPSGKYCHFLWRYAAIGSTHNCGHSPDETHFLYPCIGPLSSVDLSRHTPFRFQDQKGIMTLWRNPVFTLLRRAQHQAGLCEVCDICRSKDTRDPEEFSRLQSVVARFAANYSC